SRRGFALCPTTALREAENYGLRGWISTRSSDLAKVLLKYLRGAVCQAADRAAFVANPAECLEVLSRERGRHEDVEGPNGPAIAGISGGRRCAGDRRGGICRTRAACALGVQAAGSGVSSDGRHHLVSQLAADHH